VILRGSNAPFGFSSLLFIKSITFILFFILFLVIIFIEKIPIKFMCFDCEKRHPLILACIPGDGSKSNRVITCTLVLTVLFNNVWME